MFTTYNQRPADTQAIRVTARNYADVADYIRDHVADDRGVDVTAPSVVHGARAYIAFFARDAAPYTAHTIVPVPGFLTVDHTDRGAIYTGHHPDMFTAQYAPAPADATHIGVDPDFTTTDRVTAAVAALTAAGLPLAQLYGPYDPAFPDDYIAAHGLLVRPLVGNRLRVDHTDLHADDARDALDGATAALTADPGFTVLSSHGAHIIARPAD